MMTQPIVAVTLQPIVFDTETTRHHLELPAGVIVFTDTLEPCEWGDNGETGISITVGMPHDENPNDLFTFVDPALIRPMTLTAHGALVSAA